VETHDTTPVTSVGALRALAAEIFDVAPEEMTDDASFYEVLGIDSIQRIEFVVQLERRFGVAFTDDEAGGLDDLGRTFATLRAKGISLAPEH
jgi:acyl carrier protein